MKYNFLISSISMILLTGCAAHRSEIGEHTLRAITIVDRNGTTETISNKERLKQFGSVNFLHPQPYGKVLRIYHRAKNGNLPAYLHSYHENGQPKQFLEIMNSRAFGTYCEWYPNGCMKLRAIAIGGEADLTPQAEQTWIFDDHSNVWNEDGHLLADIYYQKGLLQCDSYYYHPNGNIWRKISYKDNLPHGSTEIYLTNGQLLQTIPYINGKKDGPSFRYWTPDKTAAEEIYKQDSLITGEYYDIDGKLISKIVQGNGFRTIFGKNNISEMHEYRHGILEGEIKVFGSDSKLTRKYHVKNGQMHGEEIEYNELPQLRHLPKLLISWYEGKIQGIVKSWYDNGVLESKKEMSENAKNGISTGWYVDGSLMLIEEYDREKLVKGEYYRKGEKHPISLIRHGKGTATLFDSEGNFTRKIAYENGELAGEN